MNIRHFGCCPADVRGRRSRSGVFFLAMAFAVHLMLLLGAASGQGRVRPLKETIDSGRFLFQTQGCASCHSVMGQGGTVGPDLTRTTVWASPMLGAAVMWNHVPLMAKARREKNLPWPMFQGRDIGDIFTFLHSLSHRKGGAYSFPGEVRKGEIRFSGTCQKCHGQPFQGGKIGPDLGPVAVRMSDEIEFATRMLRHAPKMVPIARKKSIPWPQFSGSEMASIFAYLKFFRRSKPGDFSPDSGP